MQKYTRQKPFQRKKSPAATAGTFLGRWMVIVDQQKVYKATVFEENENTETIAGLTKILLKKDIMVIEIISQTETNMKQHLLTTFGN
jgi:hypothetical protein